MDIPSINFDNIQKMITDFFASIPNNIKSIENIGTELKDKAKILSGWLIIAIVLVSSLKEKDKNIIETIGIMANKLYKKITESDLYKSISKVFGFIIWLIFYFFDKNLDTNMARSVVGDKNHTQFIKDFNKMNPFQQTGGSIYLINKMNYINLMNP
jgi:hypothetical protein